MSAQPLSVQLYSVRDAFAADPAAALARLAEIGFTTVELYGFVDRADEFAALLPPAGLTASSAHASLVGQDVVPVFEAAKKVGVTKIIDPFIPAERWQTSDDVVAIATELNRVSAIAADIGISVGYHNHAWELSTKVDGTTALEALADNLDPAVFLEVDTYWSFVGGVDPVGLLGRLGDRVQFIHVKDGEPTGDTKAQQPAGSGEVPVLDVLAAAPQAVRVVEFDDYAGDVFDGLAASVSFLTSNGESL
ncbi:sugar phosphate isomerase/epimerase family protein [Salinibacterium soli]|uniref:Sugar phosphate isomerase/epimerase n=1 Tax=Antiquaquibacter soli TaxID=3064523 RepID=A0ABT9BIS8_9MICO|nr:sugar phosphate isomerase/epimerase [Protaetiibacter sp. WY-16]MDO7880936.1 sugar phosphate isomerase/epimerase [Protaetiibacter sp. WY-16]